MPDPENETASRNHLPTHMGVGERQTNELATLTQGSSGGLGSVGWGLTQQQSQEASGRGDIQTEAGG